jgi:endonuclease/exonuclease/phosphatase family metal-dependent hydrolase
MIKGASNGKGPDIIVLEEVENENVLRNYLVKKGLAGLGYNTIVIIEGPDSRGIDVAMISKYPLARPAVLHSIEVEDKPGFKTRGILEATFQVGDSKLTVLGNHWPSQQNPVETRVRAAQVFNQVAASIHDSAVIAAGDFNTLDSDTPNGIKQYVTNKHYNEWFFDAETEKRAMVPDDSTMNPGTHWYDGEWSSLDHIFLLNTTTEEKSSRGSGKDSELVVSWLAFEIYAPTFALTDKTSGSHTYKNIPKRFDPVKLDGYSDHLPVTMRVTLQN